MNTETKNDLYCVYYHKNKFNGKIYVGQTIHQDNPNLRWKYGKGYTRGLFADAIQKYGWDNFEHYVVKDNLTRKEADILEKKLITLYNTTNRKFGYNTRIVGNTNSTNRTVSEKTKELISKKVSEQQIGLVWLHKGKKEIQVKPNDLETYLSDGYSKGRYYNKVWVHKDTKTKMVDKDKLNNYLQDGWLEGRGVSYGKSFK
ncbi:MAG: GIY-YIG nuclease family protein [bacterium]|nr:GIY-YIG nuclease family protein [bacterium]